MKRLIALFLGLASISLAHEEKPAASASLQWMNVSSSYHRFEEIKPKLINKGEASIFLSRLWPDGSARLERFNQVSRQWEPGSWGTICGVVAQPTVPIEIKPKSEEEIHVYWQLSADKWDNPEHFVVSDPYEQRPLEGHYRFILRYALEPWTLVHHPSAIYNLTSPEFDLKTR